MVKVNLAGLVVQLTKDMSPIERVKFEQALVRTVPQAIITAAQEAKQKKPSKPRSSK